MKPVGVASHRLAAVADRPLPRDCPTYFEVGQGEGLWMFTCCHPRGHLGECEPDLPLDHRDWWDHYVEPQGPRP